MPDLADIYERMANISAVGETGRGGFENQGQIAPDTSGSKSYGVFGLNTMGANPANTSAGRFAAQYGPTLGLTAPIGTPDFDNQWKAVAAQNPDALKAAQLDWYKNEIAGGVSQKLLAVGVPEAVANDPRVQGYFADRMVQQGPASLQRHGQRIIGAYNGANNDPAAFLSNMSAADKANLGGDFRTYLSQNPNNVRGLENRVDKRQNLSLGLTGEAPAATAAVPPTLPAYAWTPGQPQPTAQPQTTPQQSPVSQEAAPQQMAQMQRPSMSFEQIGQMLGLNDTPPVPDLFAQQRKSQMAPPRGFFNMRRG